MTPVGELLPTQFGVLGNEIPGVVLEKIPPRADTVNIVGKKVKNLPNKI